MLSRRAVLGAPLLGALAGVSEARDAKLDGKQQLQSGELLVAKGPFEPTAASLKTYQAPAWFRDAKFGIWAHWGPQAVPRQGDWYARWMYVPGHRHYAHHLKTYGHPSAFGYKDIINLWKAERFDPESLMDKYVAAGARYFVSMGVHHDNFDLWNSRHHRWNAAAMGPKRDIVGAWRDAARRRGIKFGVSEHLGASHNWWYPSHSYDQFWPKIGVNYDGADPQYADLYHAKHEEPFKGDSNTWYTSNSDYHDLWHRRIRDLVDSYQPDLLYSDGGMPFGAAGRSLVAHLYNSSVAKHGRVETVYTCKALGSGEFYPEACVQDVERGVMAGINPLPWQTDTSNGDWFFADGYEYKSGPDVIRMLADIVSKNGNLLLNVVMYPDGSLPPESQALLDDLKDWMGVNGEAIHGTRPWALFGEGPTEIAGGEFKERAAYTAEDIRFTVRGKALYAITLGEPAGKVAIHSLGRTAGHETRAVAGVSLLGVKSPLRFEQTDQALLVQLPSTLPTRHASTFKIVFRK
jgi:alpha-L-fucosidase